MKYYAAALLAFAAFTRAEESAADSADAEAAADDGADATAAAVNKGKETTTVLLPPINEDTPRWTGVYHTECDIYTDACSWRNVETYHFRDYPDNASAWTYNAYILRMDEQGGVKRNSWA